MCKKEIDIEIENCNVSSAKNKKFCLNLNQNITEFKKITPENFCF